MLANIIFIACFNVEGTSVIIFTVISEKSGTCTVLENPIFTRVHVVDDFVTIRGLSTNNVALRIFTSVVINTCGEVWRSQCAHSWISLESILQIESSWVSWFVPQEQVVHLTEKIFTIGLRLSIVIIILNIDGRIFKIASTQLSLIEAIVIVTFFGIIVLENVGVINWIVNFIGHILLLSVKAPRLTSENVVVFIDKHGVVSH